MRMTCPECGSQFSLAVALNDTEARRALAAALAMPSQLAGRLVRYLGLFRSKSRVLGWSRVAKLCDELMDAVAGAQVTRKGVTYAAPQEIWAAALDQVLAARDAGSLRTPLKTHGYLFEVAAALAEKAAASQERQTETRRRSPARAPETSGEWLEENEKRNRVLADFELGLINVEERDRRLAELDPGNGGQDHA